MDTQHAKQAQTAWRCCIKRLKCGLRNGSVLARRAILRYFPVGQSDMVQS
jgi:hypothetical protein